MTKERILTDQGVINLFGAFEYRDKSDGRIIIEKKWLHKNIVAVKVPLDRTFLRRIYCHCLIKSKLISIFNEINKKGLSKFIDVLDTTKNGGCYFPRHINWNVNMPLSRHSWGIAIDINPSANQLGTNGTIDPGIIEVFEDNGFAWGGRWRIPDPMHFECFQIL